MKSAGKARNNGLYRHIRTSKEIIRNLLNDYLKNHNGKRKIRQLVFETKEEFMKKAEDNRHKYAWIKDKVFVHTGLSLQEESEFDSFIFENGGTVRKSTVLNTDYLVYNADYDHETVKLRKARELKEKGSGIEILTTEEWKKLIDS